MAMTERIQNVEIDAAASPSSPRKVRLKPRHGYKIIVPMVGLLLCLSVGNVIVQGLVVGKNYQIRHWQKMVNDQEREMLMIKMDIARLESFDRVSSIAKNELGMKAAGPRDYQLIPAAPTEQKTARNSGYFDADSQNGIFNSITAWLGGIGKTMANTL